MLSELRVIFCFSMSMPVALSLSVRSPICKDMLPASCFIYVNSPSRFSTLVSIPSVDALMLAITFST
ncbi:MAG: hypothetical protein IIW66_03340, partial [Bacteroidales bacterium]|nr:hypothetical protein [Bacteroidales bacterium]